MYCTKCGKQVDDQTRFCPYCGNQITLQTADVQQSQPQEMNGQSDNEFQGLNTVYESIPEQFRDNSAAKAVAYPMKWYKFLIYFALIFGALSNAGTALSMMLGVQYGENAELVYAIYRGLHAVDIVFGILGIALAVFQIAVRQALAKYKSSALSMLLAMYITGAVWSLLYTIIVIVITGLTDGVTDSVISFVGYIVMIVCNYVYFSKRKALFVN